MIENRRTGNFTERRANPTTDVSTTTPAVLGQLSSNKHRASTGSMEQAVHHYCERDISSTRYASISALRAAAASDSRSLFAHSPTVKKSPTVKSEEFEETIDDIIKNEGREIVRLQNNRQRQRGDRSEDEDEDGPTQTKRRRYEN